MTGSIKVTQESQDLEYDVLSFLLADRGIREKFGAKLKLKPFTSSTNGYIRNGVKYYQTCVNYQVESKQGFGVVSAIATHDGVQALEIYADDITTVIPVQADKITLEDQVWAFLLLDNVIRKMLGKHVMVMELSNSASYNNKGTSSGLPIFATYQVDGDKQAALLTVNVAANGIFEQVKVDFGEDGLAMDLQLPPRAKKASISSTEPKADTTSTTSKSSNDLLPENNERQPKSSKPVTARSASKPLERAVLEIFPIVKTGVTKTTTSATKPKDQDVYASIPTTVRPPSVKSKSYTESRAPLFDLPADLTSTKAKSFAGRSSTSELDRSSMAKERWKEPNEAFQLSPKKSCLASPGALSPTKKRVSFSEKLELGPFPESSVINPASSSSLSKESSMSGLELGPFPLSSIKASNARPSVDKAATSDDRSPLRPTTTTGLSKAVIPSTKKYSSISSKPCVPLEEKLRLSPYSGVSVQNSMPKSNVTSISTTIKTITKTDGNNFSKPSNSRFGKNPATCSITSSSSGSSQSSDSSCSSDSRENNDDCDDDDDESVAPEEIVVSEEKPVVVRPASTSTRPVPKIALTDVPTTPVTPSKQGLRDKFASRLPKMLFPPKSPGVAPPTPNTSEKVVVPASNQNNTHDQGDSHPVPRWGKKIFKTPTPATPTTPSKSKVSILSQPNKLLLTPRSLASTKDESFFKGDDSMSSITNPDGKKGFFSTPRSLAAKKDKPHFNGDDSMSSISNQEGKKGFFNSAPRWGKKSTLVGAPMTPTSPAKTRIKILDQANKLLTPRTLASKKNKDSKCKSSNHEDEGGNNIKAIHRNPFFAKDQAVAATMGTTTPPRYGKKLTKASTAVPTTSTSIGKGKFNSLDQASIIFSPPTSLTAMKNDENLGENNTNNDSYVKAVRRNSYLAKSA